MRMTLDSLRQLVAFPRRFFFRETARPQTLLENFDSPVKDVPVRCRVQPPAPEPPPRVAGRPMSPSLAKAIELVSSNDNITPQDLAKEIGVSKDYARTLIKRAKSKLSERTPKLVSTLSHVVEEKGPVPAFEVSDAVDELRRSLHQTQAQVEQLLQAPALPRTSLNANRRANVLRLQQKGRPAQEIARELGINLGEVEFILKVNRLVVEHY